LKINIAGAGIGGLAAALALHQAGHDVRVFEAVEELQPLGVGINLLPQAAHVLEKLGVLDALLDQGVATKELSYFNAHGQRIWTEPRGLFAGFDAPQLSISRGTLQMTLLDLVRRRLGSDTVVTGQRLSSFAQDKSQATASFTTRDGSTRHEASDLLICADGIHSTGRHQMYPDEGDPIYSGRLLWRGTSVANPFLTGASMIMAGYEDQKFVCYPIEPVREDGKQRINWVAELRRPLPERAQGWNREGNMDDFLPEFVGWQFEWLDVPGLIRSADRIYEYPMVDRDPVPSWSQGRVSLLGDSAHPMYPIGSNGASQAILDAQALVGSLDQAETLASDGSLGFAGVASEAVALYEQDRLPSTGAIVKANRGNGPEQCMQLAHERAPDGFESLDAIFAVGELQAIADRYKQLTGMAQRKG
jgi:2-polyprenyl-6-methoxyphenol hydroxylase-like FAD-dependent oxidoreductase